MLHLVEDRCIPDNQQENSHATKKGATPNEWARAPMNAAPAQRKMNENNTQRLLPGSRIVNLECVLKKSSLGAFLIQRVRFRITLSEKITVTAQAQQKSWTSFGALPHSDNTIAACEPQDPIQALYCDNQC